MRRFCLIWEQFAKEQMGYYESIKDLQSLGVHRHITKTIENVIDSMSREDIELWICIEKIIDNKGKIEQDNKDFLISRIAWLINQKIVRNGVKNEELGLFMRALHLLST